MIACCFRAKVDATHGQLIKPLRFNLDEITNWGDSNEAYEKIYLTIRRCSACNIGNGYTYGGAGGSQCQHGVVKHVTLARTKYYLRQRRH